MSRPHSLGAISALMLVSSFLLLTGCPGVYAQQPIEPNLTRGIELYQHGDYANAIKSLKEAVKKDSASADASYYLGLAYYRSGLIAASQQRFERAAKLRPDLTDAYAKLAFVYTLANDLEKAQQSAKRAIELDDRFAEPHYAIAEVSFRNGAAALAVQEANLALQVDPLFGPALLTKSFAHFALKQPLEAIAPLEQYLALNPNDPDKDVWQDQLLTLKEFATESSNDVGTKTTNNEPKPVSGKEAAVKARVFSKPAAGYTEAARLAGHAGTVVLRCIFRSDGTVSDVYVARPLAYGLTGKAIIAARAIRFEPAIKDGRRVSQYMQLEYTFNLF